MSFFIYEPSWRLIARGREVSEVDSHVRLLVTLLCGAFKESAVRRLVGGRGRAEMSKLNSTREEGVSIHCYHSPSMLKVL